MGDGRRLIEDLADGGFRHTRKIWRLLPEGTRKSLWPTLVGGLAQHVRRRTLPTRISSEDIVPGPLVLSGHFSRNHGLGRGARFLKGALESQGLAPIVCDLDREFSSYSGSRTFLDDIAPGGVWISYCNPPELEPFLLRASAESLRGRYRVGFWNWELPELPKSWQRAGELVNEVWVGSEFIASSVRQSFRSVDAVRVQPTVLPKSFFSEGPPKPTSPFTVLAMFDTNSTDARKNPQGAIRAFLKAFGGEDMSRRLIVKVRNAAMHPEMVERVVAETNNAQNISILKEDMGDENVRKLVGRSNVFLSLHRSEGIGLVLLEAMALGTPVVATAWSGPMDFLDAENCCLVPYTLVPPVDPTGLYSGYSTVWAEPDIEAAAVILRKLASDPTACRLLGQRGKRAMLDAQERTIDLAGIEGGLLPRTKDTVFSDPVAAVA